MSFEMLSPSIREFIHSKGWEEATEPQTAAIPPILAGEHTLLIAPTGMGKTEAAVLPMFHRIIEEKASKNHERTKGILLLYITPLRALNRDMLKRMEELGKALDITVGVRHGDTSSYERTKQSKNPPEVLITTPETFQLLFTGFRLRNALVNVKYVVVDEIHELASGDRGAQMSVAMERLAMLKGCDFQRIGLSATVGDPEEIAHFLCGPERTTRTVKVPVARDMVLRVETPKARKGEEKVMDRLRCERDVARALLTAVKAIEKHHSTLMFVNTRETAEALGARFAKLDKVDVLVHHGSLSKDIRIEAEELFKNGDAKGMICTSSLELGIDIGSADLVIQYNSPRSPSRIVQRVGRSGHHVGGKPKGMLLVDRADEIAESCVIADMAISEKLEVWKVRPCPLDVLANQAIAFFLFEGRGASMEDFRSLVRKSHPFAGLTSSDMDSVLDFLVINRILFRDPAASETAGSDSEHSPGHIPTEISPMDTYGCGRKGRNLFFDNISMIPDEKSYVVRDIGTRRIIGRLDERFVASYVKPSAPIVVGGKTWEVVSGDTEEVLVEPAGDIGEIPHWTGEDLPVPLEVAQRVGDIRDRGELPEDGCGWSVCSQGRKIFSDMMNSQSKEDVPVAGKNRMVIEGNGGDVVINACFGTKCNETLGKLVSGLLAARLGQSVGIHVDAYRIMLQGPASMGNKIVNETLLSLEEDAVQGLMHLMMRNASSMKWHFVHSARKFGVVSKDIDYSSVNIDRVMEEYLDTPVYRAALERVLWEKMNLEETRDIVRRINNGDIEICTSPKISSIGSAGYDKMKEVLVSRRPTHAILSALKERLEGESVSLLCLNCKKGYTTKVREVEDRVRCIYCEGSMIAAVHPRQKEKTVETLSDESSKTNKKLMADLRKNASLVLTYGKKAVVALRGRGIGPEKASRVLGFHRDQEEFYAAILKAEVEYARNRRFWD